MNKSQLYVLKPAPSVIGTNPCINSNKKQVHPSVPVYSGAIKGPFNPTKVNTCVYNVTSSIGNVLPIPILPIQVSNSLLCSPVFPSIAASKNLISLSKFSFPNIKSNPSATDYFLFH